MFSGNPQSWAPIFGTSVDIGDQQQPTYDPHLLTDHTSSTPSTQCGHPMSPSMLPISDAPSTPLPMPKPPNDVGIAYARSVQAHTQQQMVKIMEKKDWLQTVPTAILKQSTSAISSIAFSQSSSSSLALTPPTYFDSFDSGYTQRPGLTVLSTPPQSMQHVHQSAPSKPIVFHKPYFYKRTSIEQPGNYGYRVPWSLMRELGDAARAEEILIGPRMLSSEGVPSVSMEMRVQMKRPLDVEHAPSAKRHKSSRTDFTGYRTKVMNISNILNPPSAVVEETNDSSHKTEGVPCSRVPDDKENIPRPAL